MFNPRTQRSSGASLRIAPVHAVLVRDALDFGGWKRALIEPPLTWLKAVCSLRFPLDVQPSRLRGRMRPGPRVQNGFSPDRGQRVDVVPRVGVRACRRKVACAVDVHDFAVQGELRQVAWKKGIVIFDMKLPSGCVRLMITGRHGP